MQPTILIIIGITGDLAGRKLLPAIHRLAGSGALPGPLEVVGVSRRPAEIGKLLDTGGQAFWREHFTACQMDPADPKAYDQLQAKIAQVEARYSEPAQRLFYLALPPQVAGPVIEALGSSPLASHGQTKLLLEKPFGLDVASAEALIAHTARYFKEDQLYRVDHFLALEGAQNLITFRAANALLAKAWNKDFIESIEITASEAIGIEGRAAHYEQSGALRDFVQSHLLQLAALVLMDAPADGRWQSVPGARLEALQLLQPPADIASQVVRAQYAGYPEEAGNPGSTVETFVSLVLQSADPRWIGVPVTLVTGKALAKKETFVRLRYRQNHPSEANALTIHLQPHQAIELDLWTKQPGHGRELIRQPLALQLGSGAQTLPEAYEHVILDAILGRRSLFVTSDEVLASWQLLEPIQNAWAMGATSLVRYPKGAGSAEIMSLSRRT